MEKADLMHAIYDRITVAGPEIVGVRLTQTAYAHGLALALPQRLTWRARQDSNLRPSAPEADALSTELQAREPRSYPVTSPLDRRRVFGLVDPTVSLAHVGIAADGRRDEAAASRPRPCLAGAARPWRRYVWYCGRTLPSFT